MEMSDASSDEEDEEENQEDNEMETENESELENESENEEEDDDSASTIECEDDEDGSDEDNSQSEKKDKKKPKKGSQKPVESEESEKKSSTPIHDGWEINNQIATQDIDFSQWQTSHPARETFFIGPDNYIYHNASSMKKFVDALNRKQIDEKSVSIPIPPMSKIISTNPRITVGVTGSRYISSNGEGFRVQPIVYLGKEYVSCINFLFLFFNLI